MFEAAGDERRHQAAGDVARQPGETILEGVERGPLRRAVHANQLKDVVVSASRQVDHLVGEQVDIDHTKEHTTPIHHRKRQQPAGREVLARDQHGRPIRNGHDVLDHHLPDRVFRRRGQQPARRHHPHQPGVVIDDVEVMDGAGRGCRANGPKRLIDSLARSQHNLRRPSQGQN